MVSFIQSIVHLSFFLGGSTPICQLLDLSPKIKKKKKFYVSSHDVQAKGELCSQLKFSVFLCNLKITEVSFSFFWKLHSNVSRTNSSWVTDQNNILIKKLQNHLAC